MIGVSVGKQNSVNALYIRAQGLRAEIRRGIDEHIAALVADQDRRPQPVITRIGGGADRAITSDGRHAHAGSAAQDGDLQGERHQALGAAALPASSETCTKRKRSSVREFS